jgi:hypothetical protein
MTFLLMVLDAGTWDYSGNTCELAEKISDAGYGGQVLVCSTTLQRIYSRLVNINAPLLAHCS